MQESESVEQRLIRYGASSIGGGLLGNFAAGSFGALAGFAFGIVVAYLSRPRERTRLQLNSEEASPTQRVLEARSGMYGDDVWKAHDEWDRALEECHAVYEASLPELLKEHAGKIVGIQHGKIVVISHDPEEVRQALKQDEPYLIGPIAPLVDETV